MVISISNSSTVHPDPQPAINSQLPIIPSVQVHAISTSKAKGIMPDSDYDDQSTSELFEIGEEENTHRLNSERGNSPISISSVSSNGDKKFLSNTGGIILTPTVSQQSAGSSREDYGWASSGQIVTGMAPKSKKLTFADEFGDALVQYNYSNRTHYNKQTDVNQEQRMQAGCCIIS